jgi:hypothetical protein
MGEVGLKWNQEFTMTSKKTPSRTSTAANPPPGPPVRGKTGQPPANSRQQPDVRWQRTKRYGWDSR